MGTGLSSMQTSGLRTLARCSMHDTKVIVPFNWWCVVYVELPRYHLPPLTRTLLTSGHFTGSTVGCDAESVSV